jgi:hypothetical protein
MRVHWSRNLCNLALTRKEMEAGINGNGNGNGNSETEKTNKNENENENETEKEKEKKFVHKSIYPKGLYISFCCICSWDWCLKGTVIGSYSSSPSRTLCSV